jgi:hypothetical protein
MASNEAEQSTWLNIVQKRAILTIESQRIDHLKNSEVGLRLLMMQPPILEKYG